MKYSFRTRGVCARNITFDLEDGIVKDVSFMGGCNGNLKAISKLIEGMDAQKVIEILKGNDCGGRGTSCADQLAIALEEAMKAGNNE
jgi:uncharacterized protein (TIGR03905 family)